MNIIYVPIIGLVVFLLSTFPAYPYLRKIHEGKKEDTKKPLKIASVMFGGALIWGATLFAFQISLKNRYFVLDTQLLDYINSEDYMVALLCILGLPLMVLIGSTFMLFASGWRVKNRSKKTGQ